jgi:uncharacterized protein YceK
MKFINVMIVFVILLNLAGCATIYTQSSINEAKDRGEKEFCFYIKHGDNLISYSGVYYDFHDLILAPKTCTSLERCIGKMIFYPFLLIGGLVDLPLSFVADTLILPHTISLERDINCEVEK